MRIFCFLILLLGFIISIQSCNTKRFEHAGGTVRMALDMDMGQTVPSLVTDYYSTTVLTQIFEGLVSLDPENLKVRPQIAEAFEISPDGLVYTFTIRPNVYFHENPIFESKTDRRLTCEDIIHSFEVACKPTKHRFPSPAYSSIFEKTVVGAKAFYEGKAKHIKGITFLKNKLTIKLIGQDINFLNKLANINAAIISKKMDLANGRGKMIGTGPFQLQEIRNDAQKTIVLARNPSYYLKDAKGCSLPYLDEINFVVESNKQKQLALFESHQLDLITSLPSDGIARMLEGRIKDFNSIPPLLVLRNNPLLVTNFYFFNMDDPRFKDVKVRQAFNFAIDRTAITKNILLGQAHGIGKYGIVPPIKSVFKNYDFDAVQAVGYSYNPGWAKTLLTQAGYADGKAFGTVNLRFNFGEIDGTVALEFAKQIHQNLGITVNLCSSSFEEKERDANNLKGDLFRSAWSADFSSPETFLQNFYGKVVPKNRLEPSTINQSRYCNETFDMYYEMALRERKVSEQQRFFNLAEIELLKNPPFIPLWYGGENQIIYANLRNLKENPMNYFNFREVYLKSWTKEEYQNQLVQ